MNRAVLALAASLALAVPALAAPGDMSAATFLAKADALKAKGIGALGSPDIKLLRAEGQAAGEAYRQRLAAHRDAIAEACRKAGWTLTLHRTDRPASEAVLRIAGLVAASRGTAAF